MMNFEAINFTGGEETTTTNYESNHDCIGPWGSRTSCESEPFNHDGVLVLSGFTALCVFICLIFCLYDCFISRRSKSINGHWKFSPSNFKLFQPNSGVSDSETRIFGFWIFVPNPIPGHGNSKSSNPAGTKSNV